jgi:hypothetical protein
MFAGHLSTALAIKATEPRAPTWALVTGVGFLDLLFGAFVPLGIEQVRMTPGQSPGFALENIEWSHSLAMSAVWAVVFALPFLRRGAAVATWCGVAVFSHFVLDYFMHPGDLVLAPHSDVHMGLGLWTRIPTGWWFFELAYVLACCAWYVARARRSNNQFGGRALAACAVVIAFHVINSPWLAPT